MDQSPASFRATISSMNYNVKLVFLYNFFQSVGRGVWMGNVLTAYIYLLTQSPLVVGLSSAATGLTMTIVVFPSGALADRFRREWMLRGATVFGILALIITSFANQIEAFLIALVFWGLFQGMTRPSLEALFADSVESGIRSKIYSWRHLVRQVAMASGPFLNVILFLILGDIWDLSILKAVMIVGLIISMISLVIMIFFKDHKSLGAKSESLTYSAENSNNNDNYQSTNSYINSSSSLPNNSFSSSFSSKHRLNFAKFSITNSPRAGKIVLILVACNVIIGFGAGMTVKYFTLFFMEIYLLQPVMVQLIMGFVSIFTGISAIIAQKFSMGRGRAQMIFVVQGLATICLAMIALYPPLWLLIPIFLARGSLMNSSQPLSRSILMDVVPKRSRGKINSVEALAWGLFWNVSAVLGGILVGPTLNFRLCFIVTTGLYVIGTLPVLLLIPLVAREKSAQLETQEKSPSPIP